MARKSKSSSKVNSKAMMEEIKNLALVGAGVGASGVLSGIKALTKKDLLSGPDGGGLGTMSYPSSVYREPMNLSLERYNPDLPVLGSGMTGSSDAYGEAVAVETDLAAIEII